MNGLTFLEQFASITNGRQKEFYEWELENAEEVEVVSYKDIPALREKVESFLRRFTPAPKECYRNAFELSLFDSEIDYVEGYANSVIPIEHAFNYWNGYYFDITNEEVILKRDSDLGGLDNYVKIVKLSSNEAARAAVDTGVYGNWISYAYTNLTS